MRAGASTASRWSWWRPSPALPRSPFTTPRATGSGRARRRSSGASTRWRRCSARRSRSRRHSTRLPARRARRSAAPRRSCWSRGPASASFSQAPTSSPKWSARGWPRGYPSRSPSAGRPRKGSSSRARSPTTIASILTCASSSARRATGRSCARLSRARVGGRTPPSSSSRASGRSPTRTSSLPATCGTPPAARSSAASSSRRSAAPARSRSV